MDTVLQVFQNLPPFHLSSFAEENMDSQDNKNQLFADTANIRHTVFELMILSPSYPAQIMILQYPNPVYHLFHTSADHATALLLFLAHLAP